MTPAHAIVGTDDDDNDDDDRHDHIWEQKHWDEDSNTNKPRSGLHPSSLLNTSSRCMWVMELLGNSLSYSRQVLCDSTNDGADCFSPWARFLLPDIQAICYCEGRAAVRTPHQKCRHTISWQCGVVPSTKGIVAGPVWWKGDMGHCI